IDKQTYGRLAMAGALCGLATLFTQTRGAAAAVGFAAYVSWKYGRRRKWRTLLGALYFLCAFFLILVAVVSVYLVSQAGWRTFAYSTIVFPLKYYAQWFWNRPEVFLTEVPLLPSPLELPAVAIWLFIHALLPCVYVLLLVREARLGTKAPEEPWDKLMLLAFVGMALLLSVSFSASWLRLCSVSLPALIIFAWLVKSSGR